jgi:hypothetical protein
MMLPQQYSRRQHSSSSSSCSRKSLELLQQQQQLLQLWREVVWGGSGALVQSPGPGFAASAQQQQ